MKYEYIGRGNLYHKRIKIKNYLHRFILFWVWEIIMLVGDS